MKKILGVAVILAIVTIGLFSSYLQAQRGKGNCQNKQHCSKFVDSNNDGKCDNFIDANSDGKCDDCTGSGNCDGTGKGLNQGNHKCGMFADANNDGICDNKIDANGDGKCDNSKGKGTCNGTSNGMQHGKQNFSKFSNDGCKSNCSNFIDANNDGKCDNNAGSGACDKSGNCMNQNKNVGNTCKMNTNKNSSVSNFTLNQNVPNPVTGNTKISFNLKEANNVKVFLSDQLGNKVKDVFEGNLSIGDHDVELNVTNLNPGNYFYSVLVGGKVETKQLVVVK